MIRSLVQWLRRVITQPRQELDRWQRAVRFAYDLARLGGRQLNRDRAPQMAAALAFRSLFALVPVLIVGMIVVKGLGGAESFLPSTKEVFDSLGFDDVRVSSSTGTEPAADQPQNLAEWLEVLVNQAAEVNVSAVGWIGGALIAYAAISLVVMIENAFNIIYRAPQGRSWIRRIPLYWFALTIGPLALAAAWYADRWVANWIESTAAAEPMLLAAGVAWNVFAIWVLLLAFYSLLPNTWVDLRAAAIGAAVTAVLLVAGKQLLSVYIANAFAVSQLYGSLGLVPLFMFWVYLMWLIVLFGVEVSATLQSLHGEDLDTVNRRNLSSGLVDPAIVISIMQLVADRFRSNVTTSASDISQHVPLSDDAIGGILEQLANHQILVRVEGKSQSFSLARPADKILAEDLLNIGFQVADTGAVGAPTRLVDKLRDAQVLAIHKITLAALSKANGTDSGEQQS